MSIGFTTSLKQCSLKIRNRINILPVECILVHVPDRNTRNRWFVVSIPEYIRIFRLLFTNLSSGLLVNLSRPRCICWGEKNFASVNYSKHTRGAPVTRILSGRLSWNFHDFPPSPFSTRICISWFFYIHHFLFTTRYIFHQYIYIFFSLLYYKMFILNLSIYRFPFKCVESPRSISIIILQKIEKFKFGIQISTSKHSSNNSKRHKSIDRHPWWETG